LNSVTQTRAEWRALISAAFVGAGVGLAIGGLYLVAGMGSAALERSGRAERVVQVGQDLRGPLMADAVARELAARAAPGAPLPSAAQVAAQPVRAHELDCLAQAVYFEARGESPRGQAAVATVIMNRVKNPSFPKTVCGVVYQGANHRNGCQFSFACDGEAERVVERTAWARARTVAARALSGVVLRDVGSATHFHTTGVDPEWGSRMLRVAQVGLHVFYRRNPHAAPPESGDDAEDAPQFVSRPAAPAELRLAAAVIAPAVPADLAKVATAPATTVAPAFKPAEAAAPMAKVDSPAPARPEPVAQP
jgi:hypothetical protein